MERLPEAFSALAHFDQFILYKLIPSTRKPGKTDKIPVAPYDRTHDETGVNSQNSRWWVSFDNALSALQSLGPSYGIGFVFTQQDPFFFVDIDNCRTPQGWSPTALDLLNRLAGSAVEVSQSGNGLHILGMTAPLEHGCKNEPLGLELYTEGRFIALTGRNAGGNISTDCTVALQGVAQTYFNHIRERRSDWTNEPRADWLGYTDDDELLKAAFASTPMGAVFNADRATFSDLWHAREEVLSQAYPDQNRTFNASQADAALAQHLAFWTGNNCERIERLMRDSALARDKWDDHATYLELTITQACGQQRDVHRLKQLDKTPVQPQATLNNTLAPVQTKQVQMVTGLQYLSAEEQVDFFRGCVYVQNPHAIWCPDGSMLKPEQFKASYGGYLFALDAHGNKETKNAYEAFTESQAIRHLKVRDTWFRPDLPEGDIRLFENDWMLNTYQAINTQRVKGDASPFLNHLALLLPNKRDQQILLSYMAAVVQFPGSKFKWAPLIQGAEGNGKSLFSECIQFCVGEKYTHTPRADEIGEKFNEWLFNRIFIGVEDIYIPEQKRELAEVLKPMITQNRYAMRAMQRAQLMKPFCANFIFNSNYKEAVRKTANDRRIAVFYTAQQSADDIARDMGDQYFGSLYNWLKWQEGFAIVNNMLHELDIAPELNPAVDQGGLCHRAPQTSSTQEAVNVGLGRIEQEILEAVDEQRQGFAGGWISSHALTALLEQNRAAGSINHQRRTQMLSELGYVRHPHLDGGRVSIATQSDGMRCRLYIRKGHTAITLTDGKAIVAAYDRAQEGKETLQPEIHRAFNS